MKKFLLMFCLSLMSLISFATTLPEKKSIKLNNNLGCTCGTLNYTCGGSTTLCVCVSGSGMPTVSQLYKAAIEENQRQCGGHQQ